MSFDFSRNTFNPQSDYTTVIMQQGKVQVDADWNSMQSHINRRLQALSLDTLGTVVPRTHSDAFLISALANTLAIGAGRMYVDGINVQNRTAADHWDAQLAEHSGNAALSGIQTNSLLPSGAAISYDAQPFYPQPPALPSTAYLVYLDVWQRDVTYLQDPLLIDAAIGIDSTARSQTVWQVKTLSGVGDIDATTQDLDIPGWLERTHPSPARLTTALGAVTPSVDPCLISPHAGYKGLENQLYRVEVHHGGPLGTATFKWSRDNATLASRINTIADDGLALTLDSLGRDDYLSFHPGDWVEVTDDYRLLKGIPGEIRQISLADGVDLNTKTVTLVGNPLPLGAMSNAFVSSSFADESTPPRNTRLIRWDQTGSVLLADGSVFANVEDSAGLIEIPSTGIQVALENGILVNFDLEDLVDQANFDPVFKSGDYWFFSARVNDASIELLERAPALGTHHHYSKLAIVNDDNIIDLRPLWPEPDNTGGCACTVCVDVDEHNSGTATIQQAIDYVAMHGGGTVCLEIGEYRLDKPLRIANNNITLQGAGWSTRLICQQPMTALEVGSNQTLSSIVVKDIFVLTSATQSTSAININNVIKLNLEQCFIMNIPIEKGQSSAVKLSSTVAFSKIQRCELFSRDGISGATEQEDALGTLNLSITENLLLCQNQAVNFSGRCIHANKLDITNNTISNTRSAALNLTGTALDNATIAVKNNQITRCRYGIRCSLSNVSIQNNDIVGSETGTTSISAITFDSGDVPNLQENIQVIGNRIRHCTRHAISIRHRIRNIMIKQQQIESLGGCAVIVESKGAIEYISFENNQLINIAGNTHDRNPTVSALMLRSILQADIANNFLSNVAHASIGTANRSAIMALGCNDISCYANRLTAVAEDNVIGRNIGIFIAACIGNVDISENKISRKSTGSNAFLPIANWQPLRIVTTLKGGNSATSASGSESVNSTRNVTVTLPAESVYLNLEMHLAATLISMKSLSIRGNNLDGTNSRTSLVEVNVQASCVFNDNQVIANNIQPYASIRATHAIVNNNLLRGINDDFIGLSLLAPRYTVLGNIVEGQISVGQGSSQTSLPPPWDDLNG